MTGFGHLTLKKIEHHNINTVEYWNGEPAVTFDDARKFYEIVAAERAENERRNRESAEAAAEKQQREFAAARVKAKKEADERRRHGGVLAGGRALHAPGDGPEPEWLQ